MQRKHLILSALMAVALTAHAAQSTAGNPKSKAPRLDSATVTEPAAAPSPRQALPLPGVGTVPGAPDPFRPNVVAVGNDRNAIVNASRTFPNRIVTPFASPRGKGEDDLDIQTLGQSVFVTFKKETTSARTIFVTGQNPSDPIAVITLVPQELPAQTVTLQFDAPKTAFGDRTEPAPASENYTESVRYLMRQIALGRIPEGYAPAQLPRAVGGVNGLSITPGKRYAGKSNDIYTYEVSAARRMELQESMFYEKDVQAVAFYPLTTLEAGQNTSVFVIVKKSSQGR